MSWELVSAAWKVRGLTPAEKLVLLYMADVARNPEHEFFEKHENTAAALEISERYLSECKKKFLVLKHISEKQSKRRVGKDGIRVCYAVHPTIQQVAVPTSEHSSSVTDDLCGNDKGTMTLPQTTFDAPTDDLCDTPNITSTNRYSIKRLTDAKIASYEGDAQAKSGLPVHRLSASIEKLLMGRLRDLLGPDEMSRAGGMWRTDWVRKHPSKVEAALNEMETVLKEGNTLIENRAAWLTDLLKRWSENNPLRTNPKSFDRNAGTANAGRSAEYAKGAERV